MMTRIGSTLGDGARASLALAGLVALVLTQVACGPAEFEGAVGPPVASFTQDRTGVVPGGSVQFTDTSSGRITGWSWDFGGVGVSGEQNPVVTFDDPGMYTVRLTVTGPSGVSTREKVELIEVGDPPTAGFSCTPVGGLGYVPYLVTCTDESVGATSWSWDFGDGNVSPDQSPSHTFMTAGEFTIRQTASNGVGSAEAQTTVTVHALDFTFEFDPDTGDTAPSWVHFTAEDPGGYVDSYRWYANGVEIGISYTPSFWHEFLTPGNYLITLLGINDVRERGASDDPEDADFEPLFSGNLTKVLDEIMFGPPVVDFTAEVTKGLGPLEVAFEDLSGGDVDHWEWTFGDGSSCAYPALPATPPEGMTVCDAASPTHVYVDRGSYDVTLAVTGDAVADGSSQTTVEKTESSFVRIFMSDPGFELQTAGQEIGGAWEAVPDSTVTPPIRHIALSRASLGPDLGMPSDYVAGDPERNGSLWAVVDGAGTDGSEPVATIEHGIRQSFWHDPKLPVLELDYVLLYAEPPASPVLDATIATVSDGVDTFEIGGSSATPASPYAGPSSRYPSRDGSTVRGTPVRVASIDLAEAFPSADDDTLFTLMIRVGNANNGLRSPLVYVDHIRFAASSAAPAADFYTVGDTFFTGDPVEFADDTCSDANASCIAATSFLWDFDTHGLSPAPAASGSSERSPTYVFEQGGSYDVKLTTRRGGQMDEHTETIDVYDPVSAAFQFTASTDPGPLQAPADLDFEDLSDSDAADPILTWSWDFGGWGTSAEQNPSGIGFLQAGTYTVTLTVETEQGLSDTTTLDITLE